ncbi:(2Fe-2S) ferredoxin [Paraburkholderia sp. WC7.3g]
MPDKNDMCLLAPRTGRRRIRGAPGGEGSTALLKAFWAEQQKRQAPDTVAITYSGCLGPCDQGAHVLVYPDAVLYSGVTMGDVEKIFTRHLEGGEPVQRLIPAETVW